jgi:membrane protein
VINIRITRTFKHRRLEPSLHKRHLAYDRLNGRLKLMERKPDRFGRDALQPLDIPLRGWWQVAERVFTESSRDNLSVVAAGCAFYALFAIFPAISALISLYGLVADPANVEQSFGMLGYVLPQQAYDIVIEQIRRMAETSGQTLGWGLVLSMGLALWGANSLAQALFAALNIAYEEPERRSLLQFYLSAFTFTLVGILGGLFMLIAIVYVPILFASVGFSTEFETLVRFGRWPFLALLVLFLLALLYRFGPCRRNAKWRWVSVGSLFAMTVWLVASAGFSFYVSHFAHYDKTYGSLGAVIVFLFWFYISFYIILLGAEINAELELQTAKDTTIGKPKPIGRRGFVADHVAGGPKGDRRPSSPVTRDPSVAKGGAT